MAGVCVFTPIWRLLTLGVTAAVSESILLWQRRIHRQHLTFGVTQTALDEPHAPMQTQKRAVLLKIELNTWGKKTL